MDKIKAGSNVIYIHTAGPLATNTYIFEDSGNVCVVDPANSNIDEDKEIIGKIEDLGGDLKYIINTHGHFDHITGNRALKDKYKNAEIIISSVDSEKLGNPEKNGSYFFGKPITSPPADKEVKEGDIINVGKIKLSVIETPGHTKGSVSLWNINFIFTGDTLLAGAVGVAKEYKNAFEEMIGSIKTKLLNLPPQTIILPGHGELSTIGEEREYNPFLK